MAREKLQLSDFIRQFQIQLESPERFLVSDWLRDHLPHLIGPSITTFSPIHGTPGTLITVKGHQFSATREENMVEVGGRPALVVSASATELKVITALDIVDGPVKVTVGTHSALGPVNFDVTGYPDAGAGEDGPPISFAGAGEGTQGDVNPIGTVRVLVALVRPSDRTPTAAERAAVVTAWSNVHTFYDQASYSRTNVQVDITTNWHVLDGTEADFLDGDNIEWAQVSRMSAQAAKGAVDEGFNLNNYAMMATCCNLGSFIRAWGGFSTQNFSYVNAAATPPININLSVDHDLSEIAISQSANWGRCAHEFGHNVVSAPTFSGEGTATLGEDIYASDLIDPSEATARFFDIMGSHDEHPLFSGYHMEKLGYYNAPNIQTLNWDRNPFTQEFDVVAHGLAEDTTARLHLVKIKVSDGLMYYVQVRQRPGATAQIFDENIPLGGASNQGGVIVTRVIADTLNTNQQTRFITLMHPEEVMQLNESVEDPARALRITVINDAVQARPLVCRVRVEWANTIADDPAGTFDLRVEPWDGNYQTPDIWVDRAPFGSFDQPFDSQGRPMGNGDRPRPGEINRLNGRIHVSGATGATDVKATLYAIFPPGVGDNGSWAPLGMRTISSIGVNSFSDVQVNWTPVVGQHTCLKLYASQQLGEISGGNNFAQENVFSFEAPSSSPPVPVTIPTAIRNPLEERALIRLAVKGVPRGWRVHFPHEWVWLDAKAEKQFDMTVVPMFDFDDIQPSATHANERKVYQTARVRLEGMVPRSYDTKLTPYDEPAGSRSYPIGGVQGNVSVKKKTRIWLEEGVKQRERHEEPKEQMIAVHGGIGQPFDKQRIRVTCTDPKGRNRIMNVFTDPAGQFEARFDLTMEPSLESSRRLWKEARELVKGTYRVQASIASASLAAEADSNEVFVKR